MLLRIFPRTCWGWPPPSARQICCRQPAQSRPTRQSVSARPPPVRCAPRPPRLPAVLAVYLARWAHPPWQLVRKRKAEGKRERKKEKNSERETKREKERNKREKVKCIDFRIFAASGFSNIYDDTSTMTSLFHFDCVLSLHTLFFGGAGRRARGTWADRSRASRHCQHNWLRLLSIEYVQ